jgi:hypothetical protein
MKQNVVAFEGEFYKLHTGCSVYIIKCLVSERTEWKRIKHGKTNKKMEHACST